MAAMCIKCGTKEVFIQKRGLCQSCYNRFKRAERLNKPTPQKQDMEHKNEELVDGGFVLSKEDAADCYIYKTRREMQFVQRYFTHGNWIYQPCTFTLPSGEKYTPDFYDGHRNVWIEVAGTRQAYSLNRHKYESFREAFGLFKLEIRKPTGDLLVNGSGDMWAHQTSEKELSQSS